MNWKTLILIALFVILVIYALKWLVNRYNVPVLGEIMKTV